MSRRRSLLVTPLVLTLTASAPASAADTVVAHLPRPSMIRDYAGIQVFSAFEGGAYRLAILRESKVELLPVAPSPSPFDADIGPDRNGRAQLVYTRCKSERRRRCDLFVLSLAGGSERPVRSANTSANEVAPTLWRGRIAFAREFKRRTGAVVYTRELAAPRSRPSERLPANTLRAPGMRSTIGGVAELELSGRHLAQIVNLDKGRASEVRLVDVFGRSVRRLARVGVGEGGQYFAGIGFANGYLAWARWGEEAGIYRHRLSTGALSRAALPRVVDFQVFGLALFAMDGAYIIDAQLDSDDGCGGLAEALVPVVRPCQLIRSRPLGFRPLSRSSR